jgi:hypothetical protein
MRTLLLRSLFAAPATIDAPAPANAALEEVGRALEARVRRLYGRTRWRTRRRIRELGLRG